MGLPRARLGEVQPGTDARVSKKLRFQFMRVRLLFPEENRVISPKAGVCSVVVHLRHPVSFT